MNKIKEIEDDLVKMMRDAETAEGTQKWVEDQFKATLKQSAITYNGSPIASFVAPAFITSRERNDYQQVTEAIMRCVEKSIALCQETPVMKDYFSSFPPSEQELVRFNHRYDRQIWCCRLDAFVVGGVVRFCEFNCDTPGGMGLLDGIMDALKETPAMRLLADKYDLHMAPVLPAMLRGLLSCYESWCKTTRISMRSRPRVAIVTMTDRDPSMADMNAMSNYFARQGYPSTVADVRDGVYEGGVYKVSGQPIDIVVRRGLGSWWLECPESYQGLKQAYMDGTVCIVNPLSSRLGGRKSLFAVLQSRQMQPYLTWNEQALIEKHLPWTRVVKAGEVDYHGDRVDLMPFMESNRDKLVLKPVDQAGGKDVTVGSDADDQTWRESIRIASGGGYVVQEYIPIPTIDLPVFDEDGKLRFATKKLNINFFSIDGVYAGSLGRVSESSITNVAAGGGIIPLVCVNA